MADPHQKEKPSPHCRRSRGCPEELSSAEQDSISKGATGLTGVRGAEAAGGCNEVRDRPPDAALWASTRLFLTVFRWLRVGRPSRLSPLLGAHIHS